MKRPKVKPPKTAPPPCEGQLQLFDLLTALIIETDSDPNYQRFFADVLKEEYGT